MIYEDLIVEHNSTLMVVVVTNLKWTSFSSNEFTMILVRSLNGHFIQSLVEFTDRNAY